MEREEGGRMEREEGEEEWKGMGNIEKEERGGRREWRNRSEGKVEVSEPRL